jgi:radical SAM superfamily enzyme YgiQ (UPF0313 family)
VAAVRRFSPAPILLGGVGFSLFPTQLMAATGADFGIRGDGEQALVALIAEMRGRRRWDRVPGLVYRADGRLVMNEAAWPSVVSAPTERDIVDNATYFRLGGQMGVETKRGCSRQCSYCADPLAKGRSNRLRPAVDVADEVQSLARRGIDVLHLCDAEFNLPSRHALEICDELIRRGLGERVRWYAYLTVTPFSDDLARRMRQAGCVGINFTGDATHRRMLAAYRPPHRRDDIERAVRCCRDNGITVMLDLLLGGPGETPETVAESIAALQHIDPDCVGAALGVRIYPGTPVQSVIAAEGPMEANPSIHRRYQGAIDLLQPTFYISAALGDRPAALVRELIGEDPRFFPPQDDRASDHAVTTGDHNYSDNRALVQAIAAGARGAYWDLLRTRKG